MDIEQFTIAAGNFAFFRGEKYEILRLLDLQCALCKNVTTNEATRLYINELEPVTNNAEVREEKFVDSISDAQWEKAENRFSIIAPILNEESVLSVKQVARDIKVHPSTLYRWIEKYESTGRVSSLVDIENNGGRGKGRLEKEVELIIDTVINDRYLNKQKLTIAKVSREINVNCKNALLAAPSYFAIRKRILQISERKKLARRYDYSLAKDKFDLLEGHFPGADYPLAFVQIDHTPLDVIVVDELYRKPVGRPWITVAIDVFSRMVTGFYISLDTPGALGTGICLTNSILPKEMWLSKLGVSGEWPCYGVMKTIHMDNAKEFHGITLERACKEYNIDITFRPLATPKYGGHIERLLGIVLKEVHTLPGTTFSNVFERKYYDANGNACFTIKELEQWIAEFIVNVYHQRVHSAIKMSPLAKYREGILGTAGTTAKGLKRPIINALKLKLDFMPYIGRSIQKYGVLIHHITYWSDVLRKWVHSYNEGDLKNKTPRKFIFKMDPRDISVVYFFDPELKDYIQVPYKNVSLPSITHWEHRRIYNELKKAGHTEINEQKIFAAYQRMKEIEEKAARTKIDLHKHRKSTRARQGIEKSIKTEFTENKSIPIPEGLSVIPQKKYLPFEDLDNEPFK